MEKRFYFPLTVTLYESDDYGNLDWNSPCELDGRYANGYQAEIEEKFESYTKDDIEDMATYFHGSEALAAKLKSMKWCFESVNDKLFGVVDLIATEELNLKEIEEIKDYITGQNSDGLGEGFEQQDIEIDGSVMNVHFWESGKDYRIYDEDEFEAEIRSDQGMGGLS